MSQDFPSFEWDSTTQHKEPAQIGLSRRSLGKSAPPPGNSSCLADVLELPDEIFQLSDLHHVLSTETWNSCLSMLEKQHLYSFLPEGGDPEEVVAALLSGESFNFGNPLLSWSRRLCSGDLQPDLITSHEARVRNERRIYLSALRLYHLKMIQNLQELKCVWNACKTPDMIVVEMERWVRTRKPATLLPQEPLPQKLDDVTDEDYLSQRLKRRKMPDQQSNEYDSLNKNSSSEVNTIQVNRKQFAEITSRKQSGEEVRLDNLQEVLGGSKTWQKLLHNESFGFEVLKSCWRSLARKDVPDAFKSFNQRACERKKLATGFARECILRAERNLPQELLPELRSEDSMMNVQGQVEQTPNGAKLEMNVDTLLYYHKTRTSDEDELASIQELWSYNYLQDEGPIHL